MLGATRPFLAAVAGALLAALTVTAQEPPTDAQEPSTDTTPAPSFRTIASELVVLPVSVTDRDGRFVSDITRDRFVVYDNGRRQDLSFFTAEDVPVSIGVVIDTSGSMRLKLPYVRAATIALARSSNPADDIFTIAFSDTVHDVLSGRSLTAADVKDLDETLADMKPEGQTALYDALVAGLTRLDSVARARKVLVLVSDGGDNRSRASFKDVLARARRSNASIYTIGLFDDGSLDANPHVLKALAESTGGVSFLPKSPGVMLQACDRIARDIRNSYTLGFVPPDRDGRFHAVRVQIEPADRRRLSLRTRPGYFASGDADQ